MYQPGRIELDETAAAFGREARRIVYEGSRREDMHTEVNYALGDEGARSWYGYEQWRQDRLADLKRRYDPRGVFSYYAPISTRD